MTAMEVVTALACSHDRGCRARARWSRDGRWSQDGRCRNYTGLSPNVADPQVRGKVPFGSQWSKRRRSPTPWDRRPKTLNVEGLGAQGGAWKAVMSGQIDRCCRVSRVACRGGRKDVVQRFETEAHNGSSGEGHFRKE
jgi:hypothetical protein